MSPKEALDNLKLNYKLAKVENEYLAYLQITFEEYEAITAYINRLEEFAKSIIHYSEQDQRVQAGLWGNIIADAKEIIK